MNDVEVVRGYCNVSCRNAELFLDPPVQGDPPSHHYCFVNNGTWNGTEPVCIGGFDNSVVRESETNRVRLVGGDFYGCVEMYDDVTRQWGPVSGLGFAEYYYTSNRGPLMAWADLVCRDVGFTGALATHAYPKGSSLLNPISDYFHPSYSRPSDTGPIFFLNTSSPVAERRFHYLHETVERVDRGDCTVSEIISDCDQYLMCLACQKEVQKKPCGDFPDIWNTSDVTVHCDYEYRETWWEPSVVDVLGRCTVSCLGRTMLVGSSHPSGELEAIAPYYYCNANNAQWDGVGPICIGEFFSNSDVRESKANRVRLVGGQFYGCVELYDDVTQQWGPVVGYEHPSPVTPDTRMAWADLVCRDVGFTGALATQGFLPGESELTPMSSHFYPSYTRPSETGPNFFLNTSSPVVEGRVQHLYETVLRIVQGK
ncbi:uncharacterized protein LOC118408699, partial [Branchiostoma floridae]|uniref:Uncharacterized protein LOC118408699 n=1 Tax=Branchiostoma floridae TaxID=7739 RepID=A0A9J7HX46_BRAFL